MSLTSLPQDIHTYLCTFYDEEDKAMLRNTGKFFHELFPKKIKVNILHVVLSNNLNVLKYIKDIFKGTDYLCGLCAKYGHLEMLIWLGENKCIKKDGKPFYGNSICNFASSGKDSKVYKWLCERGYDHMCTFNNAVSNFTLEDLKWMKEIGASKGELHSDAFKIAVVHNRIDVMEWLYDIEVPNFKDIMYDQAEKSNVETFKWLLSKGFKLSANTFYYGIQNKNARVLDFLIENDCPFDGDAYCSAGYMDDLELMIWLLSNNCPKSNTAFVPAIKHENFTILKWLKENDFPWTELCSLYASGKSTNGVKILQWLKDNGFPIDSVLMDSAVANKDIEVLKWARKEGFNWSYQTFQLGLETKNDEIIKWLRENGCPANN